MSNFTLFTNDSGAAGGAVDYIKDVFSDVSLQASNNTGLTDSATTNPLGQFFGNTDASLYGVKTLWIKDAVLISDRTKWISNKPTYRVIWTESFPAVKGYLFGNVSSSAQSGLSGFTLRDVADGFGVGGKIRRLTWIVDGNTSATATAQQVLDGSNTTTIDFSGIISGDAPVYRQHAASNESNDLHDYRLTSLQASTLKVLGVQVYFENTGANIQQDPGVTYVDKSKVSTTAGATFALPAMGSSLGGRSIIKKTSSSGYALSSQYSQSVLSIAQGSSGTNLVTVTTGHGASFPAGTGFVVAQGSSMYVGMVQSVSTDTLTVGPTLGFGLSNAIYSMWKAGSTHVISASLMQMTGSLDLSFCGTTYQLLDSCGRYGAWASNMGATTVDGVNSSVFLGASGFINVGGYFNAAEVELVGGAIHSATMCIDGIPAWSFNAGISGVIKQTLFTDGGPGWHNVSIQAGASMGAIGFAKLNVYNRKNDVGSSVGLLSGFDTLQAYTDRTSINSTMMALGAYRRVFADQLPLKGSWVRGATYTAAGGANFYGSSTNSILSYEYYGKNFAIIGTAASAATMTIDGVGTANTFNAMTTVASEGFHKVVYTVGSGATAQIQAFDYTRSQGEIESAQVVLESQTMPVFKAPTVQVFISNATYTKPSNPPPLYVKVTVVGGGGGGATAGASTSYSGGSGGGAGGTAIKTIPGSAIGSSETVIVGAGGAVATAGGTSRFGNFLTSTGGAPGVAGTNANGKDGGLGGVGSGGDINFYGGDGQPSLGGTADYGGGPGGNGGSSSMGGGGAAGHNSAGNATAGHNYGAGGGGGGAASGTGGAGSGGIVVVEEIYQ